MYCSTCGAEATLEVSYCKRCGSFLSPPTALQTRAVSLTGPSWAMAVTIIAMIGIIFGSVVNMAERGVSAVALTWMVIAGLGSVIALVAMIFRQLSRIFLMNQQRVQPVSLKQQQVTNELYHARQGALPVGEPAPSVTENTTRFFEPAYREPLERQK